jgi:hypothetical protein
MPPPTLPRGFGTVPANTPSTPPGDPIQRMVTALEKIADRVASPPLWNQVDITLASGMSLYQTYDRDVYNAIQATVETGELWIYRGTTASGCPMFRFSAGDTQQRALPANVYALTYVARGADTSACVFLGFI